MTSLQDIVEANVTLATGAPSNGQKEFSMVFVLASDRQPLDPCPAARARMLLKKGRAAVWKRYPFTIILNDRARYGGCA